MSKLKSKILSNNICELLKTTNEPMTHGEISNALGQKIPTRVLDELIYNELIRYKLIDGIIAYKINRPSKINLISKKFNEICERENKSWWEVFDSDLFNEVEKYAESLNLSKKERCKYNKWVNEMSEDL